MKKVLIITGCLMAVCFTVMADSYEDILKEIESNNTTLRAVRERAEARKLANRTGIYLTNPEVEFNYLWGSPSPIGDRKDFSVSQEFDFPTAYRHRNKIAGLENENIELQYKAERINVLLEARQICIELIYCNAMLKEYSVRLENAKVLSEIYTTRLENGDASILDVNKIQLNLVNVRNVYQKLQVEKKNLLSGLARLNGGISIYYPVEEYLPSLLPTDFELWYAGVEAKNPLLEYIRGEVEINREQVKLNRALNLPKFSAGYMSEKVVGEHYQGITLGMSIPLWENKNQVKKAHAGIKAAEAEWTDSKVKFYNSLLNLYNKAVNLQQTVFDYQQALSLYGNRNLLQKALDLGEISLTEYLLELEYYYDAVDTRLEAEKELELIIAELYTVQQ